MQKKFIGTLDGTLVFRCDGVFEDPSVIAGVSDDCVVVCPNCKMAYTLKHLKRSGYVSTFGLVTIVERLHVNGDYSEISHAGLAMLPTHLKGNHGSILPTMNNFIDVTPISPMLNVIPSVRMIEGLVRECADSIVRNQVRYRIVRVGFINGLYCKECDALLVNVSSKISSGLICLSKSFAIRPTIVEVLPVPALAIMRLCPSSALQAILCSTLRFMQILFIIAVKIYFHARTWKLDNILNPM